MFSLGMTALIMVTLGSAEKFYDYDDDIVIADLIEKEIQDSVAGRYSSNLVKLL